MSAQGQEGRAFGALEARLGHSFADVSLLERALTHPSFSQQSDAVQENNQRLEFLGDAVLGMILAEQLFHQMPAKREGVLTRYRSMLVNGTQLAVLARELGLTPFLLLSESERQAGGEEGRDSILEDALEAVVGAIYLDSGFAQTRDCVLGWYGNLEERLSDGHKDHNPKGQLQELLQPQHGNECIDYVVVDSSGPDHSKTFEVEVRVTDEVWGRGSGSSKKEAEEMAARQALEHWQALLPEA
ncbi:MAG: ribonuclease III [Opitutales bacterium]|nr:ribonuclease III [Opitutales bacterium]